MKRIVQLVGVLLALGMLLASCDMSTSDSDVSSNNRMQESSSNIKGVTLKIGEIVNTERTILPADWTADTASKLTYVLLAKKSTGTGGYETKGLFTYSDLMGGTAVVNLDLVVWDLKLIGYITDESYQTHPCLQKELLGEDFTTGKKTVVFDLEPTDPTDTSATGNVDVTIAWLTTKPKRLEFGIYNSGTETDAIVEDEGRGAVFSGFNEIHTDAEFAPDGGNVYKMSWHPNDVPAGIYKFAAVFYNDATAGDVIGYYIDWLYVDGGNDSIANIDYGDKFNTIPENPTWLAVETVFIPQELTATSTNVNDWYYAKFHWNDISTNETGFELVIDDGATEEVVNPTTLAGSPLKSDYLLDGTTAATATNNNLDAGSTTVVLKLKTETLYTAKIRAINKYNKDDSTPTFCEELNRNGDGKGRSYAPIVGDDKQFGMFTVNYALDGGTVTKADGSTTGGTVTNYVVGFNYSSQQQDLMTDNILSYPHVKKIGYVFDHWNDATPTRFDVIPAKNKDNLTLTAVWGGIDIRVSATFPSYPDANDVKIAADRNSDNTIQFVYSTTNNSISVTAGASLVTPQFELTEVGNNGKKIATDTSVAGHVWTWTPTNPTPGFYCLQITGTYEDLRTGRTLTLCGNIYINVEN